MIIYLIIVWLKIIHYNSQENVHNKPGQWSPSHIIYTLISFELKNFSDVNEFLWKMVELKEWERGEVVKNSKLLWFIFHLPNAMMMNYQSLMFMIGCVVFVSVLLVVFFYFFSLRFRKGVPFQYQFGITWITSFDIIPNRLNLFIYLFIFFVILNSIHN